MKTTLAYKTIFACGSLLLLTACGTLQTQEFDKNFGQSVVNARLAQTANPQASSKNQGVSPDQIDGRVSTEVIQRHHRTYTEPPRNDVNIFGIGVGGNSR
jgi:type IV pilus biogenesis protein CpaD/CtpE